MKDIEIVPFPASGYHPLVDFESWRVAVLRPCEDLLPENLNHLQKHLYTDEVFVLLEWQMRPLHCRLRRHPRRYRQDRDEAP